MVVVRIPPRHHPFLSPSLLFHRVASAFVVVAYEYFIVTYAGTFWAKQAIVLVCPVEVLAFAWYICMSYARNISLQVVFMEFLGFWSAIGGIVVAEQLVVGSAVVRVWV